MASSSSAQSSAEEEPSLFLMGWNVAGLSTVVRRINNSYNNNTNNTNKKKNQCSSMARYLELHGSPDICCFQEHKIPKTQLSNRSEPFGCSFVEGYESFWSSTNSKGMNGVVTYCKKGCVVGANSTSILEDTSLDEQGRCIMTDHGNFVVFNVYVPCSSGHSMSNKIKFLRALRRAMQKQRTQMGKAVILTGDLNLSYDKLDVHWKDLVIHVDDIVQQVNHNHNNADPLLPTWKIQLAKAWPVIVETLKTKKAVPQQTQNSKTGATYDRYRLTVTMGTEQDGSSQRIIQLGKPQQDEGSCYYGYDFSDPCYYQDPDTDEYIMAKPSNVVHLCILQELMNQIAKVDWNDTILRQIASSEAATRQRHNPFRQWILDLMSEDNMIDTFRHFYPTAKNRFTCWHQYTNTRYINEGARIDFVLIDQSLLPHLQQGGPLRMGEGGFQARATTTTTTTTMMPKKKEEEEATKKEGGEATTTKHANNPYSKKKSNNNNNNDDDSNTKNGSTTTSATTTMTMMMDPISEEAALAAATARGQFQQAPFQGGGMIEPTQRALDTQFGPRHTGIIYTPPTFSDHAAVSMLLSGSSSDSTSNSGGDGGSDTAAAATTEEGEEKAGTTTNTNSNSSVAAKSWWSKDWGNLVLNEKDPNTKRTQPHKAQKTIASFFSAATTATATTTTGGSKNSKTSSSSSSSLSSTKKSNTTSNSKYKKSTTTTKTTVLPQKRSSATTTTKAARVKSFFQPKKKQQLQQQEDQDQDQQQQQLDSSSSDAKASVGSQNVAPNGKQANRVGSSGSGKSKNSNSTLTTKKNNKKKKSSTPSILNHFARK